MKSNFRNNILLRAIKFSLLTPIIPKKTFLGFVESEHNKQIGTYSFIFGILLIVTAYVILSSFYDFQDIDHRLVNLAGFVVGVILKNLFLAYLIMLFANRLKLAEINWYESLAIISFALLPIALGHIWTIWDAKLASIGRIIFMLWNILIIVLGLVYLKKINTWKAILLVIGISITLELIKTILFGIEL